MFGFTICYLLLELGTEHTEHILDGLILQVCLVENSAGGVEHRLRCAKSQVFELLDYPVVDLIAELIEVDILFTLFDVAIYIDRIAGELLCQEDVETSLADGEAHLVGMQEHLCLLLAIFALAETNR